MFQKPKILSRPKARARTHILTKSNLSFVGFPVVWISLWILIKSKKNWISHKQFRFKRFCSKFVSSRFPQAWGPGGARGASMPISRTRALRLARVTKTSPKMPTKCTCSETVSKFDWLCHQIPQLVQTLVREFPRKLTELVYRYKSRTIWIDGTNSTNRRNLNKRTSTESSVHPVHAIAPIRHHLKWPYFETHMAFLSRVSQR